MAHTLRAVAPPPHSFGHRHIPEKTPSLSLRVMGIDGEKPTIHGLLLSNAGKSFLLVIDVILGMVFAKGNRQRIFAKWGGVVVVKAHKTEHPPKFRLD